MEEGDGCEESLFSLELLVESARVEPRLLPTPMPASRPFRPAVALRLLDFPTLLVRAPHSVPGPLVPFGRGKSCLFRLRPGALKGLLRRSPLYALLLALPPGQGPARLLGTSSVSLAAAAEELLLESGPGGRRGQFPLRDLMGEPVGELGLSYRLSNLGPCLLGHLGQGAAPGEPHIEERHRSPPRPPSVHSDRGVNLELIPEGEEDQQDPAPEGGSTESLNSTLTEEQPPSLAVQNAAQELEILTNVFCPPPMYYSRPAENPCSTPKAAASGMVTVAAPREPFPEEEIVFPSAEPLKEEPSSSVPEPALASPALSSHDQLRQTLSQLPLLNALLVELSLLSNQSLQPGPSTVHPQLAWLYQNVADGTKAPPSSVKSLCPFREYKKPSPNHKERGRSASPKLKRNRPDHLKCMYPSMHVTSTGKGFTKMERSGNLEKNNTKENSSPKRRLTYGLTNTLKLRLLRSNPVMLKVHEKREHRRKKQGDFTTERKGKSSSNKGKLLRSSPERHSKSSVQFDEKSISEENAQINENVETLIQSSTDQDYSATIKGLTCDLKKKVAARRVKSHENAKHKGFPESIGSSYKEKSLKVHLPRVCLQDTNALDSKIDTEEEKCVLKNNWDASSLRNDSQSNNFESSYGLKNSCDVVLGSENAAYSEDFTNVDSSGTALEAQEISSEPLLINPNQSQSVMDSDSKMSERSMTAESISPPVPVPSDTSPIQSLKKTYYSKSNEKATGVALNQFDHDSPSARVSKVELEAQRANKKGSKDMQTLGEEQVLSEINNSVEKGESSMEKSQSIRTSQVSSYLPSSVSDVDLSGLEESNPSEKEKDDNFEMVDITNQYRHISELVVNKLPGYTM
ncbi:microtubule-associated protein 10 [Podarcis lilfordi]|uniref:Microtubule-associated protein 10 n=1 Tax=Podarcis lilfordi TaxID=74358 RepID=A0AA35P2I8_9SAUR|nr:microtubule-associated protein 10 [Podarcis lilfordi]